MKNIWFVLLGFLMVVSMFLSGCGGAATATQAPTVTPFPPTPTQAPVGLQPGTFRFEVVGNNEDKVVNGNLLQTQIAQGYTIGMVESGDFARYGVTLFLPMDVAPGTYDLLDIKNETIYKAPMAAIFIGAWYYHSQVGGQVVITAVEDGKISGNYQFVALREESTDILVTVKGEFNLIDLPK